MNISIKVELVAGYCYRSGGRDFPVQIRIKADEAVEIGGRIDVLSVFIVNLADSDIYYGYSQSVLGVPSSSISMAKGDVRQISANAFEFDDGLDEYKAGSYRCDVKVQVYLKQCGEMRPAILRGAVEATVVD